jgi:hypothetical protein
MVDRRQTARTRIKRNARIVISDGSRIHCTVRDVTSKGASLSVPTSLGLPVTFELSFDSCRSMRQCRTVWRGDKEIGVAFVS